MKAGAMRIDNGGLLKMFLLFLCFLYLLTVDGKIFLCNGFVVSDFLCNFALQIIILHSSFFTLHSSLLTNEHIQSYIEISPYG